MTQVIGRSELSQGQFIASLSRGEGTPTVLWVVDPALTAPGAGAGPLADLDAELVAAGLRTAVASTTFPREPKIPRVDALAAEIRGLDNPVVVAVGGGSTMDGAKLAAAVAIANDETLSYALCAQDYRGAPVPTICVPTTSGTGSEASRTSIASTIEGAKMWFWGEELKTTAACLWPELTETVPQHFKAMCGFDAFAHAHESATGNGRSAEGVAFAATAIAHLCDHLPAYVRGEGSEAARLTQWGSFQAGEALNLGGTTIGHSMGHALGSVLPVAHGHAVAVVTDATITLTRQGAPEAYVDLERALDRGPLDEVWAGLLRDCDADLTFDGTASSGSALNAAACAEENKAMRDNTPMSFSPTHWADICERIMQTYGGTA
ncbi:MAG: iron-containing alcohol dehydrogenase [Alphaproteobacteria bacterium TMED89]|nr:hypothetical protein [Rhodospirillaceae bacterium]RPH15074.1 MAG: iron-containing alcohol dehydrogenase [Alphaproteobacteria bacterium TMED89]